jgi:hypothetical protein
MRKILVAGLTGLALMAVVPAANAQGFYAGVGPFGVGVGPFGVYVGPGYDYGAYAGPYAGPDWGYYPRYRGYDWRWRHYHRY